MRTTLRRRRCARLLARDYDEAFAKVDVIVTPTTPTPAFKLGEKSDDPLAMYLADIFTVTADLVGIPGISIPCGKSKEGLPIGMQILGRHFDEATVLRIAHVAEHALCRHVSEGAYLQMGSAQDDTRNLDGLVIAALPHSCGTEFFHPAALRAGS